MFVATKLLQTLVPRSSIRVCQINFSLFHKSRHFNSIQTINDAVLCRLFASKKLNFVKLFSDDVQPVNGKKKRRRVVSSDEEDEIVNGKKRFVSKMNFFLFENSKQLRETFFFFLIVHHQKQSHRRK